MRFYMLPANEGKTIFVNFDHVTSVSISSAGIELTFAGGDAPMVIPKSTAGLSTIAKGMDLSDSSKDHVNSL